MFYVNNNNMVHCSDRKIKQGTMNVITTQINEQVDISRQLDDAE